MKIAQASAASGLSIDTLRYYEKVGLIQPDRVSGQRVYSAQDLDELDSIRRLRELDISIDEIRQLLEIDRTIGNLQRLSPDAVRQLETVQTLLTDQSSRLESRIAAMQVQLATFQKMTSKISALLESGGLLDEH